MSAAVTIVGGGPVGLALALMLARRGVDSTVLDARTVEEASADRRLIALAAGTLDLLRPLVRLPSAATAPIRRVVVSSAQEFGRVTIGPEDFGAQALGATVRYGDLLRPLAEACAAEPRIAVLRPRRVAEVTQQPRAVQAQLDDGAALESAVLVTAEGTPAAADAPPAQAALVADVIVAGDVVGTAYERFTREGPLALLPLPGAAAGGRPMALVWCMPASAAERRAALGDAALLAELRTAFGSYAARIVSIAARGRYPLHEQARAQLRAHRCVWIGNAAQTLHPVAGQGLNLGLRDAAQLAGRLAAARARGADCVTALDDYERERRLDRGAVLALTRRLPGLFATRAAPVALGRSLGLAVLAAVPDLRREFARVLMYGVRA